MNCDENLMLLSTAAMQVLLKHHDEKTHFPGFFLNERKLLFSEFVSKKAQKEDIKLPTPFLTKCA